MIASILPQPSFLILTITFNSLQATNVNFAPLGIEFFFALNFLCYFLQWNLGSNNDYLSCTYLALSCRNLIYRSVAGLAFM